MCLLILGCSEIPRACSSPTTCCDMVIFLLIILHTDKWNLGRWGFTSFLQKLYSEKRKKPWPSIYHQNIITFYFYVLHLGMIFFHCESSDPLKWQGFFSVASGKKSKHNSYTLLDFSEFPRCTQAKAVLWTHFIIFVLKSHKNEMFINYYFGKTWDIVLHLIYFEVKLTWKKKLFFIVLMIEPRTSRIGGKHSYWAITYCLLLYFYTSSY